MNFISADTIYTMFNLMQKDSFFDEVLSKYFPKKEIKEEFSQELYMYIFEHPDKMVSIWNQHYFRYYFINMIKNQVISSSSKWHKNFRRNNIINYTDAPLDTEDDTNPFIEIESIRKEKLDKKRITAINKALNHYETLNPWFKTNAVFFKEHFVEGLSFREISKKYHNTPISTIHYAIREAVILVRWHITKHHKHLKNESHEF